MEPLDRSEGVFFAEKWNFGTQGSNGGPSLMSEFRPNCWISTGVYTFLDRQEHGTPFRADQPGPDRFSTDGEGTVGIAHDTIGEEVSATAAHQCCAT